MSESSYRQNVKKGVTGRYLPTCFPAALERISDCHQLNPEIYQTYKSFVSWFPEDEPRISRVLNPSYKEMITQIVWELGELTCDDVEFYAVDNFKEFTSTVRALVRRECRIVLDVEESFGWNDESVHALGLLPTEHPDYFKLVSNHTPASLQGLVSLETIYNQLSFPDEPSRQRYPFADANITALPPE